MVMKRVIELKLEIIINTHKAQVNFKQWPDFTLALVIVYEDIELLICVSMNKSKKRM